MDKKFLVAKRGVLTSFGNFARGEIHEPRDAGERKSLLKQGRFADATKADIERWDKRVALDPVLRERNALAKVEPDSQAGDTAKVETDSKPPRDKGAKVPDAAKANDTGDDESMIG